MAAGESCAVMVDVVGSEFGFAENRVVVSSLGTSAEASAVARVGVSPIEIPTAGTWGLLALGMLVAAGALWRLRI